MHLLDAFNPLFLLFRRRGGDAVHGVVPLHHPPVSLRLTGLDHLVFVVGDVKLEAVLGIRKERGRETRSERAAKQDEDDASRLLGRLFVPTSVNTGDRILQRGRGARKWKSGGCRLRISRPNERTYQPDTHMSAPPPPPTGSTENCGHTDAVYHPTPPPTALPDSK